MQSCKSSEEIEQISLFRWAAFAENIYPELKLMYHVPNEGKRSAVTGSRLKQAGLKSGVPDIVLPVARGGYIGLYIELKYGRNKTTANQEMWLRNLRDQNHLTAVCYGWEQARELIEKYLKLSPSFCGVINNRRAEHGKWRLIHDSYDRVKEYNCSNCDTNHIREYKFCPNCGARMDGGNTNGINK